jgi:F-type H+-transporting ATPase subunit gamma
LVEVSSGLNKDHVGIYNEARKADKILIILIASNRGLCGAFNANVCKRAMLLVNESYNAQAEAGNVKFYCIGKKAYDFVKKSGFEAFNHNSAVFDNLNFENTSKIAEEVMKLFADKVFDKVDIVYNSFKNAAVHIQTVEQFVPVSIPVEERANPSEYIFEPGVEKIVEEMIPKSLRVQMFKTILDSNAAEHGARMTAMHQATDNASELIKELTLQYNKARQAAITNEILEIVSGAEALKG